MPNLRLGTFVRFYLFSSTNDYLAKTMELALSVYMSMYYTNTYAYKFLRLLSTLLSPRLDLVFLLYFNSLLDDGMNAHLPSKENFIP